MLFAISCTVQPGASRVPDWGGGGSHNLSFFGMPGSANFGAQDGPQLVYIKKQKVTPFIDGVKKETQKISVFENPPNVNDIALY